LDAKVVVLVDGDLLSIKPEWIYEFSAPIFFGRADLVVPHYVRDKYDGVITNNLVYPFTKALYGLDIRQPIAGEYGLSKNLYEKLRSHPLFPLDFGIDIFIVTSATVEEMEIREGLFSLKIHESTTRYLEPEELIVPMFRQVTRTMFDLVKYYEDFWRNRRDAKKTISREFYGQKPIPVKVNTKKIRSTFQKDFLTTEKKIGQVLPEDLMKKLKDMVGDNKQLDAKSWAQIVYNFAAFYKNISTKSERDEVLDALRILWLGRFMSYVDETKKLELNEAEKIVQNLARIFEEDIDYFLTIY
jgi:hypothetical protein